MGVIGSRTSGLSINPVRQSQCLIGAGLGSVKKSLGRSQIARHAANALALSPSRSLVSAATRIRVYPARMFNWSL